MLSSARILCQGLLQHVDAACLQRRCCHIHPNPLFFAVGTYRTEDEGISGTGRDYEAQARGARAEMPSLTPQAASRRSL